jgi:hypothetical protein
MGNEDIKDQSKKSDIKDQCHMRNSLSPSLSLQPSASSLKPQASSFIDKHTVYEYKEQRQYTVLIPYTGLWL